MKFSLTAFSTTVVAVVLSGVASFVDGTLTHKRVTMGFLNHGGMWGDLTLMSTVIGFVFPYLVRSRTYALSSLFIALAIAVIAHIQWAKWGQNDATTEHIFPTHETGIWYSDISTAGWMHVVVMAMLLTIMLMYAVSPIPMNVVVTVSILLTVHVFLGTVQPGWYCTGKLWTWRNFGPPLFATALIWSVAVVKVYLRVPM